jgi:hypothetical protein
MSEEAQPLPRRASATDAAGDLLLVPAPVIHCLVPTLGHAPISDECTLTLGTREKRFLWLATEHHGPNRPDVHRY